MYTLDKTAFGDVAGLGVWGTLGRVTGFGWRGSGDSRISSVSAVVENAETSA
jgi:hypothetical protein